MTRLHVLSFLRRMTRLVVLGFFGGLTRFDVMMCLWSIDVASYDVRFSVLGFIGLCGLLICFGLL